jgi:hypothetical protein
MEDRARSEQLAHSGYPGNAIGVSGGPTLFRLVRRFLSNVPLTYRGICTIVLGDVQGEVEVAAS